MDTPQPPDPTLSAQEVLFANGNRARIVTPPAGADAANILKALGIQPPQALIIISGGAAGLDDAMAKDARFPSRVIRFFRRGTARVDLRSRLTQLFSRGIARAAADVNAVILDGGTQSGVMQLMGQGVADRGRGATLVGVSPAGKVTYPDGPQEGSIQDGALLDPNHSHFVLADSDQWGGETPIMFSLAEALVGAATATKTAVTVLVNGNPQGIAKTEVLYSVRHGWPVVVVEGSGGLADEVARLKKQRPSVIQDPGLAEIVADGKLRLFGRSDSVDALSKLIARQFVRDETLELAWQRLGKYDAQALRHQADFYRWRNWILGLGVLTTFMVVLKAALASPGWVAYLTFLSQEARDWLNNIAVPWSGVVLYYVVLALPILTSFVIAMETRLNPGNKFVLLRNSAESIKRAIYKYRTRPVDDSRAAAPAAAGGAETPASSDQQPEQVTREAELARSVEFVSQQLMQSDVNVSSLPAYTGRIPPQYAAAEADDGFKFLTPDLYIVLRLDDQLAFFQDRTSGKEKELRRYQILTLTAGAAGTFLAAVGLELWVAVTTALATAFIAYLQYRQTEHTLIQYTQTSTSLENVKAWWTALSAHEQVAPKNAGKLVETTESILETEQRGWTQQMQDALAQLRGEEAKSGSGQEPGQGTPLEQGGNK
jgi:hypothetical protein